MNKFQRIEDIDSELISSVFWEFYAEYEQGDHDVPLTIADVELLPEAAMQDLGAGGEPLVEIKVNIEKLEQLQAKIKAKQQIAETKREPLETHTDRQTRTYLFNVSCEKAMLMLLLNANSKRQSTGEPEIAPSDLLNTMTAYQLEGNAPMRSMVTCTIDLDLMEMALKFAKKSELEVDKDNPYINPFVWDFLNSDRGE